MKQNETCDVWSIRHGEKGKKLSGEGPEEATVVIVERGSVELVAGRFRCVVQTGGLFLLAPGEPYQVRVVERLCALTCRFAPGMLVRMTDLPAEELMPEFRVEGISGGLSGGIAGDREWVVLEAGPLLSLFLAQMGQYLNMRIATGRLQEIKRQEFLCLLLASYRREVLAGFLRPLVDQGDPFREFVEKNWRKVRNVEELAARAHLSTSGFIKKFGKYYDEPPYQWMLRQKEKYVLQDIRARILPLKDIADRYHFASYAHFGNFCRIHYGASPRKLMAVKKMEKKREETRFTEAGSLV